ncbi:MAG TPA: ribosome rescue protein RqcH [Candidatus Bathyarchaeia archaeon]|nr:ribosome rescue protein RqcH [Candidatus Bathyarchaeia archaeon]
MKSSMTNFDINAIISELTQRLSKSELKNIFELNDMFFFRFRTRTEGTQHLVIELGKRLHITKYKREFPPSPTGLCKVFRIHIKGKFLQSIEQYDFDRILVMKFEAYEKVYTLIIELFSKGNIILLSPENKILVAKHYKKMRDRDIHPGLEFHFPPTTGKNFMEAEIDWVKDELNKQTEKDIVTQISKILNINKIYAQEVCLLGGIEPTLKSDELNEEIVNAIITGVKKLRKLAGDTTLEPVGYFDKETDELIDQVPFPLKVYSQYKMVKYSSFSEAMDEHFSTTQSDKESNVELNAEQRRINQIIEVRRKQEEHLAEMDRISEEEKEKGNLIYLYLAEIDELLTTITNARRNNIDWFEIKDKLTGAKNKNLKGARLLKEIKEKSKILILELDEKEVEVDFLLSASDNASAMYKLAKKSEAKKPGAQKKIDELNERITKLESGLEELTQKETILIEKRNREWYEKFHWFRSSDGFLVVAGKDLRTNNELVKKYLEKDDIFLHAEIHGAAVVIIKSEGKKIPQKTIDEAGIFSVCYSKAWKDGTSTENTFWVTPDQVSFSAPSGEYLAKGSFIIKGPKNILRNIPLEIAVGIIIEEKWAYAIGAPLSAIQSLETIDKSRIVKLIPGDIAKSQMAKTIVTRFLKGLDDKDSSKVNATASNDLISILPGDSFIKKE